MAGDDPDRVHPETAAQWRDWLAEHHGTSSGVWVVWWKRTTGRPAPTYEELVCEALCFGWIDSTSKGVDEARTMMWFTRRSPTSGWSRPNKLRLERLYAEGLMQPAGDAAVAIAKENGAWVSLDAVEALVVPDDLGTALAERPGANEHWEALTRSAKRAALLWVVDAKKAETRHRRVTEVADRTAAGERPRG
jgi:uncharacterized protein YdeI (YjbR/CyaY-like superfamily)